MSIQVQNTNRGRKASEKTMKVRRAVINALRINQGQSISTQDIARKTKQSKVKVIQALRWAQEHGHANQDGTKINGRGRPFLTWKA